MRAQPDADKYLPIFVYGTLRPGQENYDRFVLGKTALCSCSMGIRASQRTPAWAT